jgi:Beta-glucan synthesis-associated protein SKN1/KRE6/Sbg1
MTHQGADGQTYSLVFSDEFETPGRTFWPGDDPYWEAVDLHYWPTGDLEWYDPQQITTENGKLVITMEEKQSHNLNFVSGMLQSWNKFCFTTGYVEVSVSLPGSPSAPGFWPGIWTMGNLVRTVFLPMSIGQPRSSRNRDELDTVLQQRGCGHTVTLPATLVLSQIRPLTTGRRLQQLLVVPMAGHLVTFLASHGDHCYNMRADPFLTPGQRLSSCTVRRSFVRFINVLILRILVPRF